MNDVSRPCLQGILLVDKPKNKSSFYLVKLLRAISKVKKIGHTGTLDPIATGLMLLLIGKNYTTKAPLFLNAKKTYDVIIELGKSTDTYDAQGQVVLNSNLIPSKKSIEECIENFNGDQTQIPPMFSAKKIKGKKLYELARQKIEVTRKPINVNLNIVLQQYAYPFLNLRVECSSGTYIRSLSHDIGIYLKTYGHVKELRRTKNGQYDINQAVDIDTIQSESFKLNDHLLTL